MDTPTLTPRSFTAHVQLTAENPTPAMTSALYDSVGEFLAATEILADADSPVEQFEPSQGNDWLSADYASAIAYRDHHSTTHPYVLATYIEGDVTRYRFTRHNDATRAAHLWAAGIH